MIPGFKETLEKMQAIQEAKNHDYAQGAENPFANFEMVANYKVASVEQGFFTRLSDKFSRVATLITREGQVADEKIEDTLIDLANYAIIFKCYLESNKDNVVEDILNKGITKLENKE